LVKNNCYKLVMNIIVIVFTIIFFSLFSFAITINPLEYTIQNPELEKEYLVILTVINTKAISENIIVEVSEESSYLKEYLHISEENFFIEPNERKNIQLKFKIPNTITPQIHNLYVNFKSFDNVLSNFKISFEIIGEKKQSLLFNNLIINAKDTKTPITFDLEIENNGNIIIEPTFNISLYKENVLIETFGDETKIKTLPNDKINITLMYDPTFLEAGNYNVKAKLLYNNIETNEISKNFFIEKKHEDYLEKIKLIKGNIIDTNIEIENNNEDISFYKIEYEILNTNIKNTIEGQITSKKEKIPLLINTNELNTGIYDLKINIYSGIKLENLREKTIQIEVINRFNNLLIIFISLLFFGIIIYFMIIKKPFKITNLNNLKNIEKNIFSVKNNFLEIENEMNYLRKQMNEFIINSNNFLNTTNLRHRFK
jgi:hypothetical protein